MGRRTRRRGGRRSHRNAESKKRNRGNIQIREEAPKAEKNRKEKKEKRNQNVKDEGKEEERKDNMKETQHSHTYIYMKRT